MKNTLNPIASAIRYIVPPLLLISASFILGMHWFLLMADRLTEGITAEVIPAPVLDSIRAYYTIVFGPMTWLIKIMILTLFLTMTLQLFIKAIPWYLRWIIFIIHAPLVLNGVFYIIPMVDKFITNTASLAIQSGYVRTTHDAHVISLYSIIVVIVLQIIVLIRLQKQAEKKQA